MEEAAVAILQALLELGLELLVYVGLDLASIRSERGGSAGCVLFGVFAAIGAGLGAAVNRLHPNPVLPFAGLRLANLVVAPLLAGGASWWLTRWRRRPDRDPTLHFWLAFGFVLAFNLVRFIYATR